MFKFEFDAINKNFCYDQYVKFLNVVNPEAEPVQFTTYWNLSHAFDHQMEHDLNKGNQNE